ncbi:hypothetical protein P8452_59347 [Trifolium repens]|nr:hypothetical protein P8452_59347 [Trifolium repens]
MFSFRFASFRKLQKSGTSSLNRFLRRRALRIASYEVAEVPNSLIIASSRQCCKPRDGSLIEIGTDFATLLCFLQSSLIRRVFTYLHGRSKLD